MFFFSLIFSCLAYHFFLPLYLSHEVIIPYGIHPFDICSKNPDLWFLIKKLYPFVFLFSHLIISHFLYVRFIQKILFFIDSKIKSKQNRKTESKFVSSKPLSDLSLFIGNMLDSSCPIVIPESGLYQNFLITGTIGTGKTASAMYPFTKQFLAYNSLHPNKKIGMLILDVKGNYYSQIKKYVNFYHLENDFIVLSFSSSVFYNPLHKPNLKPQVLADRLKTILTLFSENNSESYWLDKASQILAECIKLCRLYNDNYVTFLELHKLITIPTYYQDKICILHQKFKNGFFSEEQLYELNTCLDFFEQEFKNLDSRTKHILISEITRITNVFVSDYQVCSMFCSPLSKLSFLGFDEVIQKGKIVVLNFNVSEYGLLSKILAAYLKLDFQTEVMTFLANGFPKTTVFICDEYDKFCTKTDSDFFSVSREAKCINIVSTQSYSSLKNTLKEDSSVKVITQNLINKIWFRNDDIYTIEDIQKQLGKEEKEKFSRTISENANESNFNYITNTFHSKNSNLSESYNTYSQNDYCYDTRFFTQELETFQALVFVSTGEKMLSPLPLSMIPYFRDFL